jgi:hypothetical protein
MTTDTSTGQRTRAPGLPQELFRHWVHSREEDQADVQVYRPPDFPFPPSFGRDGFEIRPDGEFIQHDTGPADEPVEVRGRWTLEGRDRVAIRFGGAREDYAFTVVSVDTARLQIRLESLPAQYASVAPADEEQMQRFAAAPPASSFRLIDFEHADVVTLESFPPQFVLRVSGTKPIANMTVQLVPLVFIQQPEYWGIEVVGSLPEIGLPALAPFDVSLAVTPFLGTKGIEVIGASRVQRFDIDRAGASDPPGAEA